MASLTSTQKFVDLRDKLLEAYTSLAGEGVSSYSIGDQTFTLKDTGSLLEEIQKLDRIIALRTRTLGSKGYNRADLRKFNG
tara:strand:+ start:145 stop:387 length:243 start_codon:yes stop_codon:yes gene_type:complete